MYNSIHSLTARLLATGPSVANSNVKIMIDKQYRVFVVNTSDQPVVLGPCELFGFNVGGFVERLTADAKLSKDGLRWALKTDADIVIFPDAQAGKVPVPLAQLICDQAQNHGVVDVSIQDYNLTAALEAWFDFNIHLNSFEHYVPDVLVDHILPFSHRANAL